MISFCATTSTIVVCVLWSHFSCVSLLFICQVLWFFSSHSAISSVFIIAISFYTFRLYFSCFCIFYSFNFFWKVYFLLMLSLNVFDLLHMYCIFLKIKHLHIFRVETNFANWLRTIFINKQFLCDVIIIFNEI